MIIYYIRARVYVRKTAFFFIVLSILLSAWPGGLTASPIPCIWTDVRNIVAVGDLHGDYENFVVILRETGLVDKRLRWTGGATHLVQTGDIMDRGPDARKIFDLLIRLEKQAEKAGGKVHVLLGNHEEMNITGIAFDYPGYISVDQFLSFLPESYIRVRERDFLASQPPNIRAKYLHRVDSREDPLLRAFWTNVLRTDKSSRRVYVDNLLRAYGRWLLNKNVVIKINDIIFVHGGISEEYASWKLEDINALARRELDLYKGLAIRSNGEKDLPPPTILYQADGPLWNRDFALKNEAEFRDTLQKVLEALGARHMVIAHTPYGGRTLSPVVAPEALSRFDGRVWIIDTGISSFYGGSLSALIIEDGWFSFWSAPPDDAEDPDPVVRTVNRHPDREEVEIFLREADIVDIERTEVLGRTGPWIVWLDDGTQRRRAFFKYVDRRHPALMAHSYIYEIAAYALNTLLGLDIVPPVVSRAVNGLPGSLQIYLGGSISEAARKRRDLEPPDAEDFENALAEIRVFEALVNSPLYELDDTLITLETWHVSRVDFGEAFAPVKDVPEDSGIERCSVRLFRGLQALDESSLEKAVGSYLTSDQMEALLVRRDLLLRRLQALISEKGESAVLFE